MKEEKGNDQLIGNIEFEIFTKLRKILKAVDMYSFILREKHNISASQLSCLLALGNQGSISQSKLAKEVSLSPSMITGIVDQLEKKNLVERVRDPSDRRVILLKMTESGAKKLQQAPLSFQKKLADSLIHYDPEKKKRIDEGLTHLLTLIGSEVLMDSDVPGVEEKLIGIKPSILKSEDIIKEEQPPPKAED
jgi:DNA-binding MarR family transcriptional regulator